MSEETGAESVTNTEAPVAIDPSQLNNTNVRLRLNLRAVLMMSF